MNASFSAIHPPQRWLMTGAQHFGLFGQISRLGLLFLLVLLTLTGCSGLTQAAGEAKAPAQSLAATPAEPAEPTDQTSVRLPRWDAYYYFFLAQLSLSNGNTDDALKLLLLARKVDPTAAAIDIELSQFYARLGKARPALAYARHAVSKEPQSKKARVLLAALLKATKQNQESIRQYEAALVLDPDDTNLLLRLGRLYFEQKQYDLAEKRFTRLSELKPGEAEPYFYLGRVALAREDFPEAEAKLKKAMELDPDFDPAVETLVTVYEQQKRFDEASRLLEEKIKADESNVNYRLRLGRLYLIEKRKDDARAVFEDLKANEEDPKEVSIRIALIYIQQEEYAWAVDELTSVVEADPTNDLANFYLARCYEELHNQRKAVEAFLRVTSESEFFSESRIRASYILSDFNEMDRAATLLQEAIDLKPDLPLLRFALAGMYEKSDSYEKAKEVMEAAVAHRPDDTRFHYHLGAILDKMQDKEGAIREMKRVLELDPNHAEAMNYLAYTWAELKQNLNEALDMAMKASQIKPDSGHIIDTIGWIYYQQGAFPSALVYMQRAVQLMPDDPVVNEHLGDAYFKLEQYDKAVEAYEKVLKLEPEDKTRLEKKIEEVRKKRL